MSVFFFLFAAGMSVYVSFVTLWQKSIGYPDLAIGALSAASAFIAILLQPYLSLAADRARNKNAVLRILLAVQAISAFLHRISGPWPYVLAVMAALTASQSAALGLSNAVIFDELQHDHAPERFGGVRISYSWGFALAGLAAGVAASGDPSRVFLLCGMINLLALAASFLLPEVPGYQRNGNKMGVRNLFKYYEFWILLVYSFVIHITHSLAIAFLPIYFNSLGAPGWVYGIGIFIMAAAETPFLLCSGKILHRISIRSLLVVPGAAFALRWFLTAISMQWWQLLALYALHGAGVIVIYLALARYVNDNLPKELSATGQGVVNAAVISASRVVGALLGGVLSTWIGMRATFQAMGWVTLAAGAGLFLLTKLRRDHVNT